MYDRNTGLGGRLSFAHDTARVASGVAGLGACVVAHAAIVGCLCSGAFGAAEPPVATFTYSVGQGAPVSVPLVGVAAAGGSQAYVASITPPDGEWQLTCNVTVDWMSNPSTSILGTIVAKNLSDKTIKFSIGFDVEICPAIEGGSFNGASGKVTLTTNGAGSLVCGDAGSLLEITSDGRHDGSLFYCPFQLATTGSGTMSSTATLGLPGPTHPGATQVSSIGEKLSLSLTPYDTASVWALVLYKDADGIKVPECPADFDGSGVVDASDLATLFQSWGETSNCPANLTADLTGDGVVDSADLFELIAQWGPC